MRGKSVTFTFTVLYWGDITMLITSVTPDNVRAPALSVAGVQPATPEAALAALDHVAAELRRARDARAAFPDVYAVITQKVIERLHDGSGYFHAPEFISMLVGVFTSRYLQTLDWSLRGLPQDSSGWDLAYRLAAKNSLPATAHATLGISAHINYDLALGIHEVVVRLGASRDESRLKLFKHDHDAVNALLAASFPESARRLGGTHGCPLVNLLPNAMVQRLSPHLLKVLTSWRNDVWRNMLALLGATSAAERAAITGRMDDRAAAVGARITWQSTASAGPVRLLSHSVRRWRTAAAPLPPSPKHLAPIPWVAGRWQAAGVLPVAGVTRPAPRPAGHRPIPSIVQ